ncbi:MAG: adenosylcobinamide-phosphate synthase CbiB [Polyangiales bacterium]
MPADAAAVVAGALALDVIVGEPPNVLHPVVWMGHAIQPLKRLARRTPAWELTVGALYALAVVTGFALLALVVVRAASVHRAASMLAEALLLWCCFALRGLVRAGREMLAALDAGDLPRARYALGSLCSRDPAELSPTELAGASIESLAENASDSVVAPLFYYALFGVPGAVLYRAANTLDAMVGYRGRFEYLGKAAARLDDVLNLIPARLTALALLLAALPLGLRVRRGLRIGTRDARRTESPNAGWPMAVAAGLLGVRLDKRGSYVLGAELAAPDRAALADAIRLVRVAGWLAALAVLGASFR